MKTVAIISHKGGAGKTSSAVMLAEEFARRGTRTVLVDADRQRGAGLLLGAEHAGPEPRQTSILRLHYFCASSQPLRDIPARAEELAREFELAVVDTPSLDDPLARMWLQHSTHVLMVIPVEPLSIRTLESADAHIDQIRGINNSIELIGILPAMYDDASSTHRELLMELETTRGESVLNPPIPLDSLLAHRAEQKEERRTRPADSTVKAYSEIADKMLNYLGLRPSSSPPPPSRRQRPPEAQASGSAPVQSGARSESAEAPPAKRERGVRAVSMPGPMVLGMGAIILLLIVVIVLLLMQNR